MDKEKINYNTAIHVKKLKELNRIAENSLGIFTIKDCILIEIYTGKTYVYKAINYISSESKYLFHRKVKIIEKDYIDIVNKIKRTIFYSTSYPKTGMEMIDYIFKSVFIEYGYKVREDQVELSKHMYTVLTQGKISMSDIAVGLGKTHAYLVASIVYTLFSKKYSMSNMPVVISTSSIELQRAVITEYIPDISKILNEYGIISSPITGVLRKGKENYLCENRLNDYINTLDPSRKRKTEYIALKKLLDSSKIDLDEVKGISNYDKRKICVKRSRCFNCKNYRSCNYQKFMRNAINIQHHFQVCNHNYFLADVMKRKNGLIPLLSDYKAVVIDEAHKISDAALQMYGTTLEQNEIIKVMKKAKPNNQKTVCKKNITLFCNEVISLTDMLFKELREQIPKELFDEDTEKFTTVMTQKARNYLIRMVLNIKELLTILSYSDRKLLSDLRRILGNITIFKRKDIIYWVEKPRVKGQTIISAIPMTLSKDMNKDLWRMQVPILLTSGTIAVNGDFTYIKKELGINLNDEGRIVEISKKSSFDFKSNCMLYIEKSVPFPSVDNQKYIDVVANKIEELIRATNGHALVLFTSYKPLRQVYTILKNRVDNIQLIEMNKSRGKEVATFKNSKGGVLFATGSMWEGINIQGDTLSHLIIVKLPFPIPDPISEYEKTVYEDFNKYRKEVLIPKMLMKLRQGAGRLIRSETDTGVISILDIRANNKGSYYEAVINALPNCKVTNNIEGITKFISDKKGTDYFRLLDNHK